MLPKDTGLLFKNEAKKSQHSDKRSWLQMSTTPASTSSFHFKHSAEAAEFTFKLWPKSSIRKIRGKKDWVYNIRKITPTHVGVCVCVYM